MTIRRPQAEVVTTASGSPSFARTHRREIGLDRRRRLHGGPPLIISSRWGRFVRLMAVWLIGAGLAFGAALFRPVTFNRDVLPILVQNCQACHSPGRLAPMPFTTYEETRPWAAAIRAMVVNKKMPPAIAEAHPGLLGNDGRLTQSEVDTLVSWVDAGAPEGDPQDAKHSKLGK